MKCAWYLHSLPIHLLISFLPVFCFEISITRFPRKVWVIGRLVDCTCMWAWPTSWEFVFIIKHPLKLHTLTLLCYYRIQLLPASLLKEMVWEFSSAWWKTNQSEFHLHDSLFTKSMLIHVVAWSEIYIYIYLTQLTTRSVGMVSGQSFGSSAVILACITSMCSVQRFPGDHSLHLAFGSFFYPIPPPV